MKKKGTKKISAVSSEKRAYIKSMGNRARKLEERLQREKKRLFSFKKPGINECQRCGFCCLNISCVPKPDEIEVIAKFLNLTISELIRKYMVADKFVGTNYFLRFAKEGQEDITGKRFTKEHWFDFGYCTLFDKSSKICRIYPVRPLEARTLNCWEDEIENLLIKGASFWGKEDIFNFIPDFQP
ncbi:YkgJ family cysteine cluster protein [Chloroflexota bacterium]